MAVLPVAAAALAAKTGATITTSTPAVWHFLGYPFEAAGMIAALFGCVSARLWIGAGQSIRQQHRWLLDIPVSGMALAVTAALVIDHRPQPLYALLIGAGLGVLGEGIFKIAERYLEKLTGGIASPAPADLPPPPQVAPGTADSVGKLLRDTFGDKAP